jgi:hypothetical protein
MPVPDDEIGRLGMGDLAESGHTFIQIVGIGIGVGKSSALINGMDQMRAVTARIARLPGAQRNRDHRGAIAAA